MRTIPMVLAVLLVGCGGSAQKQLDDAQALWAEQGSDTYDMTVQRSCFCPDTEPVRVEVVANAVRTAIRQTDTGDVQLENTAFESWFTIDGLYAEIQAAIDAGAHEVSVTYDDALGYPVDIQLDFEQLAADDEVGYTVDGMVLNPAG